MTIHVKSLELIKVNDLTIKQQDAIAEDAKRATCWVENPFIDNSEHYDYWLECFSQSGN